MYEVFLRTRDSEARRLSGIFSNLLCSCRMYVTLISPSDLPFLSLFTKHQREISHHKIGPAFKANQRVLS